MTKNVNVVSSELRSYEDLHTLTGVADQLSASVLNGRPSKVLRKQQQTSLKSQLLYASRQGFISQKTAVFMYLGVTT